MCVHFTNNNQSHYMCALFTIHLWIHQCHCMCVLFTNNNQSHCMCVLFTYHIWIHQCHCMCVLFTIHLWIHQCHCKCSFLLITTRVIPFVFSSETTHGSTSVIACV